jgi:hypothetical protein
MKTFFAAAIAVLMGVAVATPASAQGMQMGDKESPLQKQEKLKEQERKAIEQDYEKTMKRLKSQGGSTDATANDPWASVRPAAAQAKTESKNEPKKR